MISFILVTITVVEAETLLMSEASLNTSVLVLSLVASFVSALLVFYNPSQKWLTLKGAALTLESELWKFRCRVGVYDTHSRSAAEQQYSRTGDLQLKEFLYQLNEDVLAGASLGDTAFYSRFDILQQGTGGRARATASFKHGQYSPPSGVRKTRRSRRSEEGKDTKTDDFYSPANPEDYLNLRVAPLVKHYQDRLPSYYNHRQIVTFLILLGSMSGTVLSFTGFAAWTAVSSVFVAVLTAYKAFHGTDSKLNRYSKTISAIKQVAIRWKSLPEIEKANSSSVTRLVEDTEDIFASERIAWLSVSAARKAKVGDGDIEEGEEGGSSSSNAADKGKQKWR
jgi:hypothetical protein